MVGAGNRPGCMTAQAGMVRHLHELIVVHHIWRIAVVVAFDTAGCRFIALLGARVAFPTGDRLVVVSTLLVTRAAVTIVDFLQAAVVELLGVEFLVMTFCTGGRQGCGIEIVMALDT